MYTEKCRKIKRVNVNTGSGNQITSLAGNCNTGNSTINCNMYTWVYDPIIIPLWKQYMSREMGIKNHDCIHVWACGSFKQRSFTKIQGKLFVSKPMWCQQPIQHEVSVLSFTFILTECQSHLYTWHDTHTSNFTTIFVQTEMHLRIKVGGFSLWNTFLRILKFMPSFIYDYPETAVNEW